MTADSVTREAGDGARGDTAASAGGAVRVAPAEPLFVPVLPVTSVAPTESISPALTSPPPGSDRDTVVDVALPAGPPGVGDKVPGLTRAPRHRRRWPWVVGALLLLVGIGGLIVWQTTNVAKPVTLRQAEAQLGKGGSGKPGSARPAPGVYLYTGSGTERLSLPPLSQKEGPSMPATVKLDGSNCFVFRIDYSTHHWQTWDYCLHQGDLWEAGGQSWQLWSIGPISVTNLSTFHCVARTMALPARATPHETWMSSCTGTNSSVKGTTVSAGPYRFQGLTTLDIGGTPVRAAQFLRLRTDTGGQNGTERSEVWFDATTGLPLRVQQDIRVTSPTPFGTSTYTQTGIFTLASLVPRH